MFEKGAMAGWGDMDYNSHMRNTALRLLPQTDDFRMLPSNVKS